MAHRVARRVEALELDGLAHLDDVTGTNAAIHVGNSSTGIFVGNDGSPRRLDDALVAAFSVDYLMRGVEPGVLVELWDGSEDGLEMVMALVEWGSEFVPGSLKRLVESTS